MLEIHTAMENIMEKSLHDNAVLERDVALRHAMPTAGVDHTRQISDARIMAALGAFHVTHSACTFLSASGFELFSRRGH